MIVIDMDMPKCCGTCNMSGTGACKEWMKLKGYDMGQKRADTCPIKCDIEDIKAELQTIRDMYEGCEYIGDKARRDELWHVLEVIDKHIKGESK